MKRFLFLTQGFTLLFLLAPPAQAENQDNLSGLCGEKAISASGEHAAFNQRQCNYARAKIRTLATQTAETCTCDALLNVAYELGIHNTIARMEATGTNCINANFAAVFDEYNTGDLSGKIFGGALGALASKSLVKADEAIRVITQALGEGRVVAVSLNAIPIYNDYAARHNISFTKSGFRGSHALLVRAAIRNAAGVVTHFVVVDSSGPERVYPVPYSKFRKGYTSVLTYASRGVYISNKRR